MARSTTWTQTQMAALLGLDKASWSRILAGQMYPTRLQTMQKIEFVFGWPVSEQVQLIPPYWDWPMASQAGVPYGEPTDFRYCMKLERVMTEWLHANPKPEDTPKRVGLHPALKPIYRHDRRKKEAS